MIIGISGKMQVGKDLTAQMIQVITSSSPLSKDDTAYKKVCGTDISTIKGYHNSPFKVVKFADAIKDIVCILTGCTRDNLEDNTFKDSLLPEEWIRYGIADGFIKKYLGDGEMGTPIMINKQCDKERYITELESNWQTAYKSHLTYRELLQRIGTDLFRVNLHDDVWVNALLSTYKVDDYGHSPNWIISDVRFPNELDAIYTKDSHSSMIRITRDTGHKDDHISEIALDNVVFLNTIQNDKSKEELFNNVYDTLVKLYPELVTFKYN